MVAKRHTARMAAVRLAPWAACGLILACTSAAPEPGAPGELADAGARELDAGRDVEVVGLEEQCTEGEVGATPLRHLTRQQYDNTVFDLLGLDGGAVRSFPPDQAPFGYAVGDQTSRWLVERYIVRAQELAVQATEDLDSLLACDRARDGERACAQAFIVDFVMRGQRRAPPKEEVERYLALFELGARELDFRAGIQMVVQAVLSSPRFLYHLPSRSSADVVPIDGYAMASRLSYALWNSMPDRELLQAAGTGELDHASGVATQTLRMLEDPRAERGIRDFHRQWLALDGVARVHKDPTLFPDFDHDLAERLDASLVAFVDEALTGPGAGIERLLLGGFAHVDEATALTFGIDPEQLSSGSSERQALDPIRWPGLLTHPGLTARLAKPNQTDPVARGQFIRERLLCQTLPAPPPDLAVTAPDPEPGLSTRERFAEHAADPLCAGCHELMDPLGFGLEHYDAVGRHRESEGGLAIDARGEIVATLDLDGPFDGARELSERLARSHEVARCLAREITRYALSRADELDACSLGQIERVVTPETADIHAALRALTATHSFRHRRRPTTAQAHGSAAP